MNNENRYKKLSHREHILHRPETYIGSIISQPREVFLVDRLDNLSDIKIVKEEVSYNAGFVKIFDEILTNASDHFIRTKKVKNIKVTIEDNRIEIENDGPGVPVEIHKEEGVYIPELIFGHLLTGENYDDSEERIVGGRNGYGAKLTNCYSKSFIIETADGKNKFVQEFNNNLQIIGKPVITKSKKNYTKIIYFPDLKRFGMKSIKIVDKKILLKRVLDVATYCKKLKVYWNGDLVPIKNFKNYMQMYKTEESGDIYHENLDDSWEVGVMKSNDDAFDQVSMVNGISTIEGGTHVNYITNQVIKGISDFLAKKHKNVTVKSNDIKRNLFVFVNAKVVNPEFATQTKENLTTRLLQKHIKDIDISDKLIKNISQSEIINNILKYIEAKEIMDLKNTTVKKSKVKIAKLDDAIKAGSSESKKCMLFLTEGDSAKTSALTGFSETGRKYFGAFALKGKPLNVRDAALTKIQNNKEIMEIIEALGLTFGEKYTDVSELRYGRVVIMSDQDLDGFHIKGLLINLFDYFWPELLQMDFLYEFITPIVRVKRGKLSKYFYRLEEYKTWKETNDVNKYSIKYYKGLGTIEKEECKLFFKEIDKHLIRFNYRNNKYTKDCIDLAFREKRADDRKIWLSKYNANNEIDKFTDTTYIDTFIDEELIEFSMYDNIRSIPNYIDGLKPAQRKILYTIFKKKYTKDVKVVQLCGSILETAAYHHGDASLQGSIVSMAQDFVGTNNINTLDPIGQFGSRLKGGKDAAAARYISTALTPLTKKIYKIEDENILDYKNDDGYLIEPEYYLPIIPMLLVNGSKGIGTGHSTDIPQFNPNDIITYFKNKLTKSPNAVKLTPFYRGFKGTIEWNNVKRRYVSTGILEEVNTTTLQVHELPIGTWTDKYIEHLDKLTDLKIIREYENNSSDTLIDIKIHIYRDKLKDLKRGNKLMDKFNMETLISINNMVAFDENCKLRKFENQYEILDSFYKVRLGYYQKRKDYLLTRYEADRKIILNRMKFIKGILDNDIVLKNKKRVEIDKLLETLGIERNVADGKYDYLLNMTFISLSNEKLHELKNSYEVKRNLIVELNKKTTKRIWLDELDALGHIPV